MPTALQILRFGVLLVGALMLPGPRPTRAQMSMSRGGRSLGGYGAATISSYYSGGGGGYVPYTGGGSRGL